MMERLPILIGVAGGSGSGKTHLVHKVRDLTGPEHVAVLSMDQYFLSEAERDPSGVNFDHPAHLDLELMIGHLEELKRGKSVLAPTYDFRTMRQTAASRKIENACVVLVEGLFVLAEPMVRLFDLTCFLDVESDQRLLGRILRDMEERDADMVQIVDRYQRFVRPSYYVFVAPTKQNADIVVDFTYRRALFTHLLATAIQSYVDGGTDLHALIGSIKTESYRLGYKPQDAYMPMTVDIRELAKAYPESARPPAVPPAPEEKPKLFLEDGQQQ